MTSSLRGGQGDTLGERFLISALNPGIGLVLALAFFLLWQNFRHRTYLLLIAASFAGSAMGFVFQDVALELPLQARRLASISCFLVSAILMSSAILKRSNIAVPYPLLFGITGCGMLVLLWFLLVMPHPDMRVFTVSISLGGVAIVTALWLTKVREPRVMDRLLLAVTALSALNLLCRPVMMALHSAQDDNSWHLSFWMTVQFTQPLIWVTVALTLLVALAAELIRELTRDAETDDLSALLNRRGFEAAGSAALAASSRRGETAALLIADLDHFKQINDTHGHATGDTVITLFGELVRREAGDPAVAGRIGGEEFAVLLPGYALGPARELAERLRIALPQHCAGRLPPGLMPSVSIGIGVGAAGQNLYDLMAQADKALYLAKSAGRDRVGVLAPGSGKAAGA